MTSRPNVLVLFTDDQRFDTIRALGNPDIVTPNMDRLVQRGTTFTHAHIPCGTCGAVCMPSRAMLNTGRTLFHLQKSGESIPAEHTLLGEMFRANGYQTFGTGKWHNGKPAFQRSFSGGDEIFFGGMADHWNVPVFHYDPDGRYDRFCLVVDDPWRSNKTRRRDGDHIHAGRHSTDVIADAAIRFLETRDTSRPFFLYTAFLAPHDPRTMPPEFLNLYDPARIPLPENFLGGHPFDNGALRIRDEELAAFPRSPDEIRRHLAEYYGMISHLDAQFGRILKTLDDQGLTRDTVIVFAGDNGLALGQHGLMGKQSCYDHSVRVPLVFAGPGVPEDVRSDALVYLLDIFPTLCDLTDLPVPGSVEGTSLAAALRCPQTPVRDSLYFAYAEFQRAVRKERYKLVEYVTGGRHTETQLFDLETDPKEMTNLAKAPRFAATVDELRRELCRLRDAWDDAPSEWGQRFWSGYDASHSQA